MKLPKEKKERIKILTLILIGSAGVLYAVVELAVNPIMRSYRERLTHRQTLQEDLDKARREIEIQPRDARQKREAAMDIQAFSDRYVLRRRLGNLLISATETIERHAATVGIRADTIREIGIAEIPTTRKTKNIFQSYAVRVNLDCGYHDLLSLLNEVEQANPFLCVSSLTVDANPGNPAKHKVSFDVQWPVWAEAETAWKESEDPEPDEQPGVTTPVAEKPEKEEL